MARTILQQGKTEVLGKITALYEFFQLNQDYRTSERARDLIWKLNKQEYSIAFCGHFSAGKSSMINQLVGENLLPTSPIPTSANLVKIKTGEAYAKVIFKEGKPRVYPAPYDYEHVKSYCRDGDQIHSIEMSYDHTKLPKNAVIMDTPGIDSTDDAHRIATESALHLADLVFYVMDYNHVQSELNFLFTKELTAAGKQVYLIINQIDKHRDEELSFAEFKTSVEDSFASWGVKPARIFYTSLRDPLNVENEYVALQNFIGEKLENGASLLPESVFQSLMKLTTEHALFLEEKNGEERERFETVLSLLSMDERADLQEQVASLEKKIQKLQATGRIAEQSINTNVDEVLKNAYLMPFQTRELAESYIEACQKNFKIGLFFSRQKTEQERAERLAKFHQDLSEIVKSQLDWHLKEQYVAACKENDIHDPTLLTKIQSFQLELPQSLLIDAVKEGALLSGDYVLQYTNEVAELVKRLAKNRLNEIKEQYLQAVMVKNEQELKKMMSEYEQVNQLAKAWHGLNQMKEQLLQAKKQMEAFLSEQFSFETFAEQTKRLLAEEMEEVEIVKETTEECSQQQLEQPNEVTHSDLVINKKSMDSASIAPFIEKLIFTAKKIENVPGFKRRAVELVQKAERLQNRQFTVALFGAFSAGKSSFANALIGEKVLPVSPNPTTAAINKIMPVNQQYSHGTVLVKVKESDVLFDDVNRSLQIFDFKATDFDDAIVKIQKVMTGKNQFDASEKTHFAFLQAFLNGFTDFRNNLGTMIHTNLDELKDYVALEEKSCFVEIIEVYYDCALTQQGITLVDTPGADSINARHTGVAFDYIKNADAILFVTYYNHAFSKADREFLIQLGRVKDSFELDKMFFIVNAVDLANDEEEKESVLNYVGEQLTAYGIRRPSLFGLSSLQALTEKQEKTIDPRSNIDVFEKSFYSFITNELMDISITTAEQEWQRALNQLRSFIHSSEEDKELKHQKHSQLEQEQEMIKTCIQKQEVSIYAQKLTQEADELTYYIKQRVFLRFNDFAKEAFNPALLKDDGRNLKKALQMALNDFIQSFGFDFAQELRATTVRMEAFIGKLMKQAQESVMAATSEINSELIFSPFEVEKMAGIEFETAFLNEEQAQFKKALAHFKNPKSFFEKNERKYLVDELERNMQDPSAIYLEKESIRLKEYYIDRLNEEFTRLIAVHMEQIIEYYNGLLAVLSDDFPIEELQVMEKEIVAFQ
ncbi:small GTP-binding protein [Cytobacillus eiseniae]|uniref:Small GTP-binding protein n=1 Tax=Cytobacillus eiseniae TaxID=762947 RepID=A0ABS4REY2_9BACI|nr:dynamin family protein [Cytobacillus eiseniae]MBP2241298.1 small GTP-binding protein [Cytobacillus eiseniae]